MRYFVNILKQFNQAQRLTVLFLLLSFTAGSYLISQYLKTDDCRTLIQENIRMHEDFAKISEMLRKERMKPVMVDSVIVDRPATEEAEVTVIDNSAVMDEILKIAEQNK